MEKRHFIKSTTVKEWANSGEIDIERAWKRMKKFRPTKVKHISSDLKRHVEFKRYNFITVKEKTLFTYSSPKRPFLHLIFHLHEHERQHKIYALRYTLFSFKRQCKINMQVDLCGKHHTSSRDSIDQARGSWTNGVQSRKEQTNKSK